MEPGVSIESGSAIRVVVLPVGRQIPLACLREVARHTHVNLAYMWPYYLEHHKSPFTHQPWDAGCPCLKFVLSSCVPLPWESSRKVLAVVGICHLLSSLDLGRIGVT
uniref:Uncharacterized protein n=1 Tax=Oryza punctata TaxID=4537 RepID=A0A0E0LTK2_ORYPU